MFQISGALLPPVIGDIDGHVLETLVHLRAKGQSPEAIEAIILAAANKINVPRSFQDEKNNFTGKYLLVKVLQASGPTLRGLAVAESTIDDWHKVESRISARML